jgi:hypothetical protein
VSSSAYNTLHVWIIGLLNSNEAHLMLLIESGSTLLDRVLCVVIPYHLVLDYGIYEFTRKLGN